MQKLISRWLDEFECLLLTDCVENSKSRSFEILANDACWSFQPLQGSVESIRAPAAVFAVFDMVPHIAASGTHRRS